MPNPRRSKKSSDASEPRPNNLGESVARTVAEMWQTPVLRAHRNEDCTQFVFTFPFSIPDELKSRNPDGYQRLFPGKRKKKGLSTAFVKAYSTGYYAGKPIKKGIRFLLREIVIGALRILFEEHKDLFHQDEAKAKEEGRALRKGLVKTGVQADARKRKRQEIKLAKRYRELHPIAKLIKKRVKERKHLGVAELGEEITRAFPYPWISYVTDRCAFQNMFSISGRKERDASLSGGWTPRQLALGVIACEKLARDPNIRLKPSTIYEKYVTPGNGWLKEEERKRKK